MFWFLAIYGGAFFIILVLGFPETLRAIVGNGSRIPKSFFYRQPLAFYQRHQETYTSHSDRGPITLPVAAKHIDFLAPFRILIDKRALSTIGFLALYYAVWQMSITVMSTQFASIYKLNETEIGLTFIANGIGSMFGTITTGKLLDFDYRRVNTKYECDNTENPRLDSEFPIERARLRLVPLFALLQCYSIMVFGWTINYQVHISAPIVTTFATGWAAVSIQSAITTYLVDVFTDRSASATAALNLARCLLGAAGTAAANPMIEGVGIGFCFTILTVIMLLSLCCLGLQTWSVRRIRRSEAR